MLMYMIWDALCHNLSSLVQWKMENTSEVSTRKISFYDDVREQACLTRPISQEEHLLINPSKKSQLALAQHVSQTCKIL